MPKRLKRFRNLGINVHQQEKDEQWLSIEGFISPIGVYKKRDNIQESIDKALREMAPGLAQPPTL